MSGTFSSSQIMLLVEEFYNGSCSESGSSLQHVSSDSVLSRCSVSLGVPDGSESGSSLQHVSSDSVLSRCSVSLGVPDGSESGSSLQHVSSDSVLSRCSVSLGVPDGMMCPCSISSCGPVSCVSATPSGSWRFKT